MDAGIGLAAGGGSIFIGGIAIWGQSMQFLAETKPCWGELGVTSKGTVFRHLGFEADCGREQSKREKGVRGVELGTAFMALGAAALVSATVVLAVAGTRRLRHRRDDAMLGSRLRVGPGRVSLRF